MKVIKKIFEAISVIAGILAIIAGVNLVFHIEERMRRKIPEGGRFYNWKYGKVFYHKRGSGFPVILLHGFEPHQSGKELVFVLSPVNQPYGISHRSSRVRFSENLDYIYHYLYVLLIRHFIEDVIGDITDLIACGGSGLCALQTYKTSPILSARSFSLIRAMMKTSCFQMDRSQIETVD